MLGYKFRLEDSIVSVVLFVDLCHLHRLLHWEGGVWLLVDVDGRGSVKVFWFLMKLICKLHFRSLILL
jgi:hypothetical protein